MFWTANTPTPQSQENYTEYSLPPLQTPNSQSLKYNNHNLYRKINNQTIEWPSHPNRSPSIAHHYKTITRFGKHINFTGKQRGTTIKLFKWGSLAHEASKRDQTRPIKQPIKKRSTGVIRRKKKIPENWAKSKLDLSVYFENFVTTSQPTMAFYPIKRRSYKKKKKIFILKYKLKIAKPQNRLGKLFLIIKKIYFQGQRKHSAGDLPRQIVRFWLSELATSPTNPIQQAKIKAHERFGQQTVNEAILRRRLNRHN